MHLVKQKVLDLIPSWVTSFSVTSYSLLITIPYSVSYKTLEPSEAIERTVHAKISSNIATLQDVRLAIPHKLYGFLV